MTPAYWEEAKTWLSQADPCMAKIIATYRGEALRSRGDAFQTLARSIVGQQISVKAADAVWGRLGCRIGESGLRESIAALSEDELRTCGLSRRKVIYLKSLAEFFEKESITQGHWDGMEDGAVIRHLTQVKGIGRWSAEMFLIFHLLRPDVFPVDDIGLQKAIKRHYGDGLSSDDRVSGKNASGPLVIRSSDYRLFGTQWQPYRSVATWYLWRSLDPLPVEY